MSSVTGVTSAQYQAIQGALFMIEKVSAARNAAKALDMEALKSITGDELMSIQIHYPDPVAHRKYQLSGIEPFVQAVGSLIDTFFPLDEFSYSREYLLEKEILGYIEDENTYLELKYFANPSCNQARTGKLLIDIYQTGTKIKGLHDLFSSAKAFEDQFPTMQQIYCTTHQMIEAHENLVEILKKEHSCLDLELIEALKKFDEAYFTALREEKDSFSSKNFPLELMRMPYFLNAKQMEVYDRMMLQNTSVNYVKFIDFLSFSGKAKFIENIRRLQLLCVVEASKEAVHHSDETIKNIFADQSKYMNFTSTSSNSGNPIFDCEPPDLSSIVQEMQKEFLKTAPSTSELTSYQLILTTLTQTTKEIVHTLTMESIEEKDYWIMQYLMAVTLKNMFFHQGEEIKVFNNRRTETLFGQNTFQISDFLKNLSELSFEEKEYFLLKIESMRPYQMELAFSGSDGRRNAIDSLYSQLVQCSSHFLKCLCQEDEKILPSLFLKMEEMKTSKRGV